MGQVHRRMIAPWTAKDPFGEERALRTRWSDLGWKVLGLLEHRRVWIALLLVIMALVIVGAIMNINSGEEPAG